MGGAPLLRAVAEVAAPTLRLEVVEVERPSERTGDPMAQRERVIEGRRFAADSAAGGARENDGTGTPVWSAARR